MSFATFGRACQVPEALIDEFVKRNLKRFAEKQSPPKIFNGMPEIIKNLAGKHTLAIVTTNSAQNVNAFLLEHGLDRCFQAVYGIDTQGSKAQKIAIAQNRFLANATRESVFMIGDALSDIHAAKEASVTSIAITWGHQSLTHLLRGNPDYVIHTPHELLELINKIT
jgi:phosphoglycolate phosphatase